jgi:hypothetical protein
MFDECPKCGGVLFEDNQQLVKCRCGWFFDVGGFNKWYSEQLMSKIQEERRKQGGQTIISSSS